MDDSDNEDLGMNESDNEDTDINMAENKWFLFVCLPSWKFFI